MAPHHDPHRQLLSMLADGNTHSGMALAKAMNISRNAIWKRIRQLRTLGIDITSVPGAGYRLTAPLELLDEKTIIGALPHHSPAKRAQLTVLGTIDSTNDYLLRCAPHGDASKHNSVSLNIKQRAGDVRDAHGSLPMAETSIAP